MSTELNAANLATLRTAIMHCWAAIGSDTLACCEEGGEPCTNEMALESCIDANRLADYGGGGWRNATGVAADTLVTELIEANGYDKVMNWLKKNIHLEG